MLPPTRYGRPARASIAATSEVVVVLPLLPVMPIVGPGQRRRNSRVIEVSSMPRSRAWARAGMVRGTDWETKTWSLWAMSSMRWGRPST